MVSEFLERTTFAEQSDWADRRTQLFDLNGQSFRMVVDRPTEGNEHVVVVPSEFATGISPPMIVRARIIRDMVDPAATLVVQPNTTFDQPNMNYSRAEQRELRRGRLAPVIGRIMMALEYTLQPEHTTVFGSSQGAVVALGFGADRNTPSSAVAVIEAPNVTMRNRVVLTKDFIGCAHGLKDVILSNYEDKTAPFALDTLRTMSRAEPIKCVLDGVKRDNLAMVGAMARGSASQHIKTILDASGSVAHAWGTADRISTAEDNRRIADQFADHPHYCSAELPGACHGVTSAYALNGALARMALQLKNS